MANEIIVGFEAGNTIYSVIRDEDGDVWYPAGNAFETWGTGSRSNDDYDIALTDMGGGLYMGDFPSAIPNGTYYLQTYYQAGSSPASTDTPYGGPTSKTWNGSSLTASASPGSPGTALTCSEMIDEIQQRVGRPDADTRGDQIVDMTWCTRRLNEAQRLIVQKFPNLPCVHFSNKTTFDTTGTYQYAITDLTYGDSTTDRAVCRISSVWYLDGHQSKNMTYLPRDEFDAYHPDPTHADEHFGKPCQWTMRNNTTVDTWPYCASGYWDKDMRFDGDFYPKEFTTDVTGASDLSMADEGLILYAVWRAWAAIGDKAEEIMAQKAWSNPNPSYGEKIGWLEEFQDYHSQMVGWNDNLYVQSV